MGVQMSKPFHVEGEPWPRTDSGDFYGHVLPGAMFLAWSTWWGFNVFSRAVLQRSGQRSSLLAKGQPLRPWYAWAWAPSVPVEPLCKALLPLIGFSDEFGFEEFPPRLYDRDGSGRFVLDSAKDWQHSTMYLALMISGLVDLLGTRKRLPHGTEHMFLVIGFSCMTLMFWLHAAPPDIEILGHHLQVGVMAALTATVFLEVLHPFSQLLAAARVFFTLLLCTWFWQLAYMLYLGVPQWDPNYPGSLMFMPVAFCCHLMIDALLMLGGYLLVEAWFGSKLRRFNPIWTGAFPQPSSIEDAAAHAVQDCSSSMAAEQLLKGGAARLHAASCI